MRKIVLTISLWLCCASGLPQQKNAPDHPIRKIMIDPDNAMGGTVSKYFDSVTYIPLETTKESLFGKIFKLQVTDQYYIILDRTTDAILFFNKDGSYHHKITRFYFDRVFPTVSQPEHKFSPLLDFTVDPLRHTLYVRSVFERNALYIYTEEGTRIGKTMRPQLVQDFILVDGTGYTKLERPYSESNPALFAPYDVAYTHDTTAPPQYLFPVNFKYDALTDDSYRKLIYFSGAPNDSVCLYIPDMDYNLYELDKSGIRNQYQLLFPQQYSLPPRFATDSIYTHKRQEYLKDKKLLSNIWNAFKVGDCLFLDLRIPTSGDAHGGLYTLLYSLTTSRLITLDRLSPDSSTCQLPISGYMRSDILGYDKGSLYTSFPSSMMFELKSEMGDQHPPFSKALENYFNTQSRQSNPVLIQLTPAANF
jgi:6-bladed beta-propeller